MVHPPGTCAILNADANLRRNLIVIERELGNDMGPGLSRRAFLGAAAAGATALALRDARATEETYATHARGIRILPGHWRPHYPWEQIAWVSPSWPSQDYLWLDFPEAIFSSQGLLFLSHVNPPFPTVHEKLPSVPWTVSENGMSFERMLPDRIAFGGSLMKRDDTTVDLELHIHNGSGEALNDITLQTCAYLRGIKEFAAFTRENKYIHTADRGWISMEAARALPEGGDAPYCLGWRGGNPIADLPVAVATSGEADRLFAFTWGTSTLSLVGNPNHPCVHADPKFPDLAPGERASIKGRLIFFEGKLEDFDVSSYFQGQ